jgi:hypothetical protein
VERLTDHQLLDFARSRAKFLPPRVKRWLEYANASE